MFEETKEGDLFRDEVTACCLGLKRLGGLTVNHAVLRKELYKQLEVRRNPAHCTAQNCRFRVLLLNQVPLMTFLWSH